MSAKKIIKEAPKVEAIPKVAKKKIDTIAIDKASKKLKELVAERGVTPIHSAGRVKLDLKINAIKRELCTLRG